MNKRLLKAKTDHNKWLITRGLHPLQIKSRKGKPKLLSTWDAKPMPKPNECYIYTAGVKSIWEKIRLGDETPETIKEIIAKSTRIAPLYNKGPLQYIGNDKDVIRNVGKKNAT